MRCVGPRRAEIDCASAGLRSAPTVAPSDARCDEWSEPTVGSVRGPSMQGCANSSNHTVVC